MSLSAGGRRWSFDNLLAEVHGISEDRNVRGSRTRRNPMYDDTAARARLLLEAAGLALEEGDMDAARRHDRRAEALLDAPPDAYFDDAGGPAG